MFRFAPDGFHWTDANTSYDVDTALTIAPKLADAGVKGLESPLPPNRIRDYQALKRQGALPILMDEGIVSPVEVAEFIALGMFDGIAMKVARCGGLMNAARIVRLLEENGLLLFASGLSDPDLSLAASAHLFAWAGLSIPAALNGPQYIAGRGTTDPAFRVFLTIWQVGVMLYKMPAYLLPAPTDIAHTFIDEFPKLLRHGWVTTYEMLLGYALAVAIAIPLAVAITSSKRFDDFVMPTMLFFQVVPKVAIAPLFLVWFGVGATPKVLVAFLISFFPIVIDAAVGLRSMSPEMTDLARSMGATRMQVFAQFRLPTSLPYLFSGLKVAATLAIAGAVVGEFVGADKGLGYLLLVTNSNMETSLMFATIVALTIIGLAFFYSVEFIEALLIPWHVTHRVREEAATM